MKRFLLPLLAMSPSLALAQVNTEQYRSEEDAGWTTTIEVDFGLKKGNVDLLQAGFDVGSRWQSDANSVLLIADGGFATKRTLGDYVVQTKTDTEGDNIIFERIPAPETEDEA